MCITRLENVSVLRINASPFYIYHSYSIGQPHRILTLTIKLVQVIYILSLDMMTRHFTYRLIDVYIYMTCTYLFF